MRKTTMKLFAFVPLLFFATLSCGLLPPSDNSRLIFERADGFYTPDGQGLRYGGQVAAYDSAVAADEAAAGGAPVEPDVYCLDREAARLYAANAFRGLVAFDISAADAPVMAGRISVRGLPKELYPRADEILLLTDPAQGGTAATSAVTFVAKASFGAGSPAATAPRLELGGAILDSRVVGNTLIIATNEGRAGPVGASVSTSGLEAFDATLHVVDLVSRSSVAHPVTGTCTAIHVAADAVFVALRNGDWGSNESTIQRYDLAADGALVERGGVVVGGYVADRFKLDWKDGWLRVLSHDSRDWTRRVTRAFAVDWRDPSTPVSREAGALELAEGESLWASRFDGDLAYVVTFFTKDPLFVLSFADPSSPALLGELVMPGYSTHLEPFAGPAGEKLLFAVGVDGGRTKASIFDVGDPTRPLERGSLLLGDVSSWSSANWDWKRVNRLAELGAFALPYYHYDAGGGEFRVAVVSCAAAAPALLCELPDSGDVERTIAVASGLAYTYAADRLQSWRLSGGAAARTAEVVIVENVVYAGEIGGTGVKIVRNGERVSVRSFPPEAFGSTDRISRIDLPETDAAGDRLWYPLGDGGVLPLPEAKLLLVLAESWGAGTGAKARLAAIRIRPDMSLELDPALVEAAVSSTYGPPPHRPNPRIVGMTGGRVFLFHGDLTIVDAEAWPSLRRIPCPGGVEALPFGESVALFSWAASGVEGYGRMSVELWDLSAGSPIRERGPLSFPGRPLWRSAEGLWLAAYEPASWLDETRILAVSLGDKAELLGETKLDAGLREWRDFGSSLAIVGGPHSYYILSAAPGTAGMRADFAAGAGSEGGLGLYAAGIVDEVPVLRLAAGLEGWTASLAATGSAEEPRRLVAATASGGLVLAPEGEGFAELRSFAFAAPASYWSAPGLSIADGRLWAALSYGGIECFDLR